MNPCTSDCPYMAAQFFLPEPRFWVDPLAVRKPPPPILLNVYFAYNNQNSNNFYIWCPGLWASFNKYPQQNKLNNSL